MASRKKNRRAKRRRLPERAAEQDSAEDGRPGAGEARPKSRIAAATERIEQVKDDRPAAPWGKLPLGPISVLAGVVLIIIGAINSNPKQLALGVVFGALGGLELAVREHFAGYRSHSTLLAGFTFVISVGGSYYLGGLILWQSLLLGAVVAVVALWLLVRAFQNASGGLTYKLR